MFQLILFSRQKGSPVNYFKNSTMPLTQIYELIFNFFSFKFWLLLDILVIIFTLRCCRYRQGGLILRVIYLLV